MGLENCVHNIGNSNTCIWGVYNIVGRFNVICVFKNILICIFSNQ